MSFSATTVIYGRSVEELEVIASNCLRGCELDFAPWLGIEFDDQRDCVAFALEFTDRVDIEEIAMVPPDLIREVDDHLERLGSSERVRRHALVAVRFWNEADRAFFDAALGFDVSPPTRARPLQSVME
jgi:hypothetical protein